MTDDTGLESVVPEEVALRHASIIRGHKVFDAFSGLGGSAIAMAKMGKEVISADTNPERVEFARHNAGIYGVAQRISFLEGSFFDLAPKVEADAVFLDPQLRARAPGELGDFLLCHLDPDGKDILSASLANFDEVVMRVPKTLDMAELGQFGHSPEVHTDVHDGVVVSKTVVLRS